MAEGIRHVGEKHGREAEPPLSPAPGLVPSDTKKTAISFQDVEVGDEGMEVFEKDFKKKQVFKGGLLLWLTYQATGVVYGDIGTSPLYVYSSTFSGPPSYEDLLGALSLIIWSITLIVTVKYVFIILCADDEGEGGTFAVYCLLSRYSNIMMRDPRAKATVKLERYRTNDIQPTNRVVRSFMENTKAVSATLKTLAVLGVSLIMADGVLTPAQSVLGAIQGIEVVTTDISTGTIIGVSCAILVLLFLAQPLGIAKLGSIFAPIVIIWLSFNFAFGIYNLVKFDVSVFKAFSPYFAGEYLVRNRTEGWKNLGGILLAFTGVEALFADLGAFGKRAIQLSWLCFVYPCLLLAYIGQAAYISRNPSAYSNPFFKSVPPGMFWPSLVISILAAIVASQAIITGTFKLLHQVMSTSHFPQIKTVYTSTKFHGQVYVPMANWLLMIGCVIVTAAYSNTTRLGHAYGFCVILVTFITTCLVSLVALIVWRIHSLLVLAIFIPFVTLDALYLSSAITKVPDGAWFTLLLAVILASVFILWRYGKESQWAAEVRNRIPANRLFAPPTAATNDSDFTTKGAVVQRLHPALGGAELSNIKGLGIFFDKAGEAIPAVYAQFLQKFEARPDVLVFLQLRSLSVPIISEEDRYVVGAVPKVGNCYRVTARHGYNEQLVTAELGGVVYKQVRGFIVRNSVRERDEDEDAAKQDAEDGQGSSSKSSRPDPLPALTALDKAGEAQTVYIVGKEQLRLIDHRSQRGLSRAALRPAALAREVALMVFLWMRENSRAKVASMRIPIEKLVEVGFVREM